MAFDIFLDESIRVSRPFNEVFHYLLDFSNCCEWDPGVSSARKITPGVAQEGTEFYVLVKALVFRIPMHYRLIHWEIVAADSGSQSGDTAVIELNGQSRSFSVVDTIRLRDIGGQTEIHYTAGFNFSNPLKYLAVNLPGIFDGIGKQAMLGLERTLAGKQPSTDPVPDGTIGGGLILPALAGFTKLGYLKASKSYKAVTTRLDGQHIVITGATSGIGLAVAENLAAKGAAITLIARSERRGKVVQQELELKTGSTQLFVEQADLSSISDIRALCCRLLRDGRPIDVLINNAGAIYPQREQNQEGFEKSLTLLLLAPFLMTETLRPLLELSDVARVINVSSGGMYAQKLDIDALQGRGSYSGVKAYANAKRALVVCTEEWAKQWEKKGILVNAMHPGWVDTPGIERGLPGFYKLTQSLLRSPRQGADTIVWLASSGAIHGVTGAFWLDRQQRSTHLVPWTKEQKSAREGLMKQLESIKQDFQM